jgi:outer membrane protein OmpA-like peptidoglycan-associated protein
VRTGANHVSRITTIFVSFLLLLAGLSAGCAGSKAAFAAWKAEFARYERDTRALGPRGAPGEVLRTAQVGSAAADSLQQQGRTDPAARQLQAALADVRAALALTETAEAEERADGCVSAAVEARHGWDEALRALLMAEQVARRTADGVPHQAPDPTSLVDSSLPAPTAAEAGDPPATMGEVLAAWNNWTQAAQDRQVATADLEGRYDAAQAAAGQGSAEARALALREAGRITQELEARVRRAVAHQRCVDAAAMTAELGQARDAALRGTPALERDLQDTLRTRLEKMRTEAESRQDQLYDAMSQLEGKYASIRRDARGTIVSLADILFDFNKATLRREVEFALVRVATILNQFPEMTVRVEGHTDNVGTEAYNLDLSKRRAESVRQFLVSQEVAAERLSSEGFGLSRPVADNATPEGRQKNRRVDLVIEDAP